MGTPGDKTSFTKVAESDKEPLTPRTLVNQPPSTSFQLIDSTEMGVISRLPELHLLTAPSEPIPQAVSKPEVFQHTLEQASIEDYFSQTKYYSNISENLTTLYSVAPPSTFQSLDQPGPSGLQILKSKSSSPAKLKKKKHERVPPKKSHTCPICHKSFSTGEKFNKHYQSHSGATQFKCEHCKKTFSSKFKLVRHALIHSDKKPFSCTVCERTFHRKDHLKNHIKVHSPTKKLYECEKNDCNKQYTSLLSYRKHLAVHSAEDGNLTCQICFVSFGTKEEILYHLKIHAGSRTVKNPNEKKYLCEYCDRRFFTKKDVRRHLVVHTGMRDFLCQFCPQRFGRKDHLVRHIKKSHHKQYSEEPSLVQVKIEVSKPETITSDTATDVTLDRPVFLEPTYTRKIQTSLFRPSTSKMTSAESPYASLSSECIPSKTIEIKREQIETSILEPDSFKAEDLGLEGVKTIFEEESLTPLNEDELFLSSQSTQSELKELCSEIFKHISETPPVESALLEQHQEQTQSGHQSVVAPEEQILDPQMFNILQESDNNTLPLPGFSQTFQAPPPP